MVRESGVPLGCLADKVWVRDGFGAKDNKSRRLEERESYRWIEALSVGKLRDLVKTIEVGGEFQVEVGRRGDCPAREATVRVRWTKTPLCPPSRLNTEDKPLEPIEVFAVYAVEPDPPESTTALEWLSITNVEVATFSDAIQRIGWYKQRWQIEVYFKVLKSGTRVEAARLATKDRLLRYIALMSVIAWRLYWMTMINRHTPDADCTHVLHDLEWKALYCVTHKTRIFPEKGPSVSEVVLWIAKLGGFLGRKSDGNPGVTVLWRGWQKLHYISDTFAIFHNAKEDGTPTNHAYRTQKTYG